MINQKILILNLKKKQNKNIFSYFYLMQFYKYVYFFFKKLTLLKLINSSMYYGFLKKFYNQKLSFYFLGFRSNKIIFNILYTLMILKQFILFIFHTFNIGGNFLTCCNLILPEILFEFFYNFKQGFVLGMPYGGLLTNKGRLISKLKQTTYGFYDVSKISQSIKKKVLYSERMVYNIHFQKNYFEQYQLPHCLILLNLNSYIFYEAMILNIPIFGLVTNMDKLGSIIFPLLFNNDSIYSLFLLLILLNNLFLFGKYLENIQYKFKLVDVFKNKNIFNFKNYKKLKYKSFKINSQINFRKLLFQKRKKYYFNSRNNNFYFVNNNKYKQQFLLNFKLNTVNQIFFFKNKKLVL